MSSWAAVASAASKPKAAAVTTVPEGITAVVDANAIISGMQLDRLGDTAVTIPAVLAEIRDAASRQRLATLPLGITTMEPSEESLAAVTRFARLTGDVGTLSSVDMRVLALAHMLTVAVHGDAVLRNAPPPPKAHAKSLRVKAHLPGWGAEGAEWDALDALPDVADAPGAATFVVDAHVNIVDMQQGVALQRWQRSCTAGTSARLVQRKTVKLSRMHVTTHGMATSKAIGRWLRAVATLSDGDGARCAAWACSCARRQTTR